VRPRAGLTGAEILSSDGIQSPDSQTSSVVAIPTELSYHMYYYGRALSDDVKVTKNVAINQLEK
jgi:hypothetical protein